MNLAHKSVLELKDLIEKKEITSREVWDYYISRAKQLD